MNSLRMPNVKSFLLAGVAAMCVSGAAIAADLNTDDYTPPPSEGGWYLRGDLGWSWLNWDGGEDDGAMTGGGGLGYAYGNGVRADMRVDYSGKYETGAEKFATTTALVNAYYDFPVSDIASPYVGAGLGWGWAGEGKTGDDDGFAWSLMAGLNLRMTDSIVADVGYRYRDIGVSGDNLTDHSILAGMRFSF